MPKNIPEYWPTRPDEEIPATPESYSVFLEARNKRRNQKTSEAIVNESIELYLDDYPEI